MFGSQELSPGYIIPASKDVLPPRQQSWLTELASQGQPGSPSQLVMKITQKKLKLGIARDGNVESGVGLGRVASELSPSEVPVKLDSLVVVVG